MRRSHFNLWIFVTVITLLSALAPGLLPPPVVPAPPALGVNLHGPAKVPAHFPVGSSRRTDAESEWAAYRALAASIPKGTPVRIDALWHEYAWDKNLRYLFENVEARLAAVATVKGPITIVVIPLPWPGSWGWARASTWGALDPADFPGIEHKWLEFFADLRPALKRHGITEERVSIHLGNEAGANHPGGNAGYPVGEWDSRIGTLYERLVRTTDWGAMTLVLPSLSFQDEDVATAGRERRTAGPILRKLARAKKGGGAVAAIHLRLYAPNLSTEEYAAAYLARRDAFRKIAQEASGRKEVVFPEVYLDRSDRATDDRAEVLHRLAPHLGGAMLYRIGPGPTDAGMEMPAPVFLKAISVRAAE